MRAPNSEKRLGQCPTRIGQEVKYMDEYQTKMIELLTDISKSLSEMSDAFKDVLTVEVSGEVNVTGKIENYPR